MIIMLVIIVILNLSSYRIFRERRGNKEKLEELEREMVFLEERKMELETSLEESSDEEYIERVLREDFLMQKPGEKKVIILTEEEEEEEIEEEESRWDRFLNYLPWR